MKRTLMILLPVLVLVVGVLGAWAMIVSRPEVETRTPEVVLPLVRVLEARPESVRITVRSQGTVAPRTESALVPEVSGRVIRVSPSLVSGGFFENDEILLELDPIDYEQAVVRARAEVEQAGVRLALERAEAEVARKEWQDLGRPGTPPPLVAREPQVAESEAALAAARAGLALAERDLERTRLRAPYPGRVREENVDVGQFVTRGTPVARLYAVDHAEVRLPVPDEDLRHLDLPLDYRGESRQGRGPEVILRARFAGRRHAWRGRIVRTEGEIDPRTRMLHVVARVEDPYGRDGNPERPPLAVGLFVEAEILGRRVDDVVAVPRSALRADDRVLVVDDEDRLRFRSLEVLRVERDRVLVSSGLMEGERVCLTPLAAVTDGMRVRT